MASWVGILACFATLSGILWGVQQPWFRREPAWLWLTFGMSVLAAASALILAGPVQRRLRPERTVVGASPLARLVRGLVGPLLSVAVVMVSWEMQSVLPLALSLGAAVAVPVAWRAASMRTMRAAIRQSNQRDYDGAIATVTSSWVLRGAEREGLLAALELDAGRSERAEERLRHLTGPMHAARRAHHLSMLAVALHDQGRVDEALTVAQEGAELHPDQPAVVLRLAVLAAELGDVDDDLVERAREAVEATRRSMTQATIAPSLLPLHQGALAYVLAARHPQEAKALLASMVPPDAPGEGAEVRYRMARAHAALGDIAAAREHVRAAADGAGGATARRCERLRATIR